MQLLKPYNREPERVRSQAQEPKDICVSMPCPFFSYKANEQNLKPPQTILVSRQLSVGLL